MSIRDPLPHDLCVAIFGLGGSGLAAAKLLSRFGKQIIASDISGEDRREDFMLKLPPGTQLVLGHNEIGDATAVVTSPGLEPTTPILMDAVSRNIPVVAELELGFRATDLPIVAITGTDGKTTTTTLTSHILNACGVKNHMGGNVGIPLAKVVMENEGDDCLVVETSAFQLVFCPDFRPHVLIATNIAEDHSEYFKGDWKKYVDTKRRPLEVMGKDDIVILNASDPEIKGWKSRTTSRVVWYGASHADIPADAVDYAVFENDLLKFHFDGQDYEVLFSSLPQFIGMHNAMNIMGAVLAALSMGCRFDEIVQSIHDYQLPPHRISFVCEHHGVKFIDDSKATNPHAGIAALNAVTDPMVLIVGGVDKGLSLTTWLEDMRPHVKHLMVIGALGDRFCAEAESVIPEIPRHRCESLQEAVKQGYQLALKSKCSVVMLSPGCSSYDMFKSYGERGDVFAQSAMEIEKC